MPCIYCFLGISFRTVLIDQGGRYDKTNINKLSSEILNYFMSHFERSKASMMELVIH
jgi:hypothetical protein